MMRGAVVVLALLISGCREQPASPRSAPAQLDVVTDLPAASAAGTPAGVFTVRVTDAASRPLSGVLVNFAASIGAGRPEPTADTTSADGTASSTFTVGTAPGQNQLSAVVSGLPEVRSTLVIGAVGPVTSIALSQRIIRINASVDSLLVTGSARDRFGNAVPELVNWTSRNPNVVVPSNSPSSTAYARVVSRPGHAWLVASIGPVSDSILVAVHDATSSPCDFIAPPADLDVGGAIHFENAGRVCVRSSTAAEYAVVAHYSSPVSSSSLTVGVAAHGVSAFPSAQGFGMQAAAMPFDQGAAFENALRQREVQAISAYIPTARAWYQERQRANTKALTAVAREGDMLSVNVNAYEFCSEPAMRSARVMAITDGTIMLEDTSNPAGGFSPEEYREMARAMDTLVLPVDTAAFGAPSDIDNNGRIGVLFTRAVNELTPRGSALGVVLGFYYVRDLLPKTGTSACPGSNMGEMFYVLVPDPAGEASQARTKSFVHSVVLATIAHELQHLINASRRMYVNSSPAVSEEPWLNEGLSHIAEELLFYRVAGIGPRQNIGAAQLKSGTAARAAHDLYMRGNFGRLSQFLQSPESNSPVATNDQLATRGASWSLLRYIADRIGSTDGDLWRRLVNARTTGVVNLDAQLLGTGLTTMGLVRDWSTAIYMDDNGAVVSPALSHPSWDYRSAMPQVGMSFGLVAPALADGVSFPLPLRAGGSAYLRLAVAPGRQALVQLTNNGGVPQPGVRLTLVRTR